MSEFCKRKETHRRFSGGDDAITLGKLFLYLYLAKLTSFDLWKPSEVQAACEEIFHMIRSTLAEPARA